ncbi:Phage portal protein [Ligilactobacillus salivarius]|uniref:phage portal protein n=1 Tax=Ligilactobacillus salivarius TaxID=1624 RepID=UPI0013DD999D|nr:phage portal protein [Ligilactobacillus salivarius]MDM8223218.1 phage portal protein [Ligilactobacillus salivarius]QIG36402.1 Phage portal protein [Ligilactobacillus salivarius]
MLFKFEKRDWASDYLTQGTLPSWNNSGNYIGISALKNSDILTAVSHIASNVARFPIVALDKQNRNKTPEEMDYLINKSPNGTMNAYHWKFVMTVNAILTGDGFSRIVRDPKDNKPLDIEYYPTSQVSIDDSDVTNVKYHFTPINGKEIVEPIENVIHFMFFTYDGIHGRSPLLSLKDEIGLQEDGIATLRRFFKSGMKGGLLKAKGKLNKEARRKMREEFEYAQRGATTGSPIVIDSNTEYSPIEVDTNVLQLINSNNYSTSQIAKALHIPAYKLAINSPNQSIKQLNEDFIRSDLPYYFNPIASDIGNKMLNPEDKRLLRVEFDTRKETGLTVTEAVAASNGTMITPNEARYLIGLEYSDEPDLERFQSTLNTVFLDQKEEYQKNMQNKDNRLKGGEEDGQGNQTSNN